MTKYIDNGYLQEAWVRHAFTIKTENLDQIRKTGLLFTKIVDSNISEHVVASIIPCRFKLVNGQIDRPWSEIFQSAIHDVNLQLTQELQSCNYYNDQPRLWHWERLTECVYKIAQGVALNFKPLTPEIKEELVHEAAVTVLSKIKRGIVRYTPGKAPLFNLLTTSIIRVMYSIKTKEKRIFEKQAKLINDARNGTLDNSLVAISMAKSEANA